MMHIYIYIHMVIYVYIYICTYILENQLNKQVEHEMETESIDYMVTYRPWQLYCLSGPNTHALTRTSPH